MVSLVTVAQLAAYPRTPPGLDVSGAQPLLDALSDEIRTYCGWHIAPTVTEIVTVDGSGTDVQGLPTLHLLDLLSVTDAGTALTVADVEWSTNGTMRRPGRRWTTRLRGVVAEIRHGYAETPPMLVALICEVVLGGMVVPVGVAREQSGGESVTYTTGGRDGEGVGESIALSARALRLLDRYRIAGRP